jgi:hypothetical protein
MSDHDPLLMELHLAIYRPIIGFWVNAVDADRDKCRFTSNDLLQCIDFSNELLLCNDLLCEDEQNFPAIHKYDNDISEACMQAARMPLFRSPAIGILANASRLV